MRAFMVVRSRFIRGYQEFADRFILLDWAGE